MISSHAEDRGDLDLSHSDQNPQRKSLLLREESQKRGKQGGAQSILYIVSLHIDQGDYGRCWEMSERDQKSCD